MKAFIIEDEPFARRSLERLLGQDYPSIEVSGYAGSVDEAVEWLGRGCPDVVFMDVELSDGTCFDVLVQVKVDAPIVIVTAYDKYAIRAFENGAVDYLLKPIERKDLSRALARCLRGYTGEDYGRILSSLVSLGTGEEGGLYHGRMLIRVGGSIYPIKVQDLSYIYSDRKSTFLVTVDKERYPLGKTLEEVTSALPGEDFFQVSRNCTVSRRSILSVSPLPGGRYSLDIMPGPLEKVEVSRMRAEAFSIWMKK